MHSRIVGRGSADIALAVAAARELHKLDSLVLYSGDSDFVPLIESATGAGVATTVIAPRQGISLRLALAADNRIDPSELMEIIDGLIWVGDGPRVAAALARYISKAKRHIVIIDNYMSEETIRLAAGVDTDVDILLIGRTFNAETTAEAAVMKSSGKVIRLIRHGDVHDRWLKVNDEWFHSGCSFKDIGKKLSRISGITDRRKSRSTRVCSAILLHLGVVSQSNIGHTNNHADR
ncbi:MAG: NYN domain-containing protein [Pseudonocardiaceae bacterium]